MSLPSRLLGANPSIQVSSLLSGTLTTPSAKQAFEPASLFTISTSTGSASSFTLSSIPQTYRHLQLRMRLKNARTDAPYSGVYVRLNADSGANYSYSGIDWDSRAGAPFGSASSGATSLFNGQTLGTGAYVTSTSVYSYHIIDIFEYSNTNYYTTACYYGGYVDNGSGYSIKSNGHCHTSAWHNTAAVTSIAITTDNPNFDSGTHIALYGIKE